MENCPNHTQTREEVTALQGSMKTAFSRFKDIDERLDKHDDQIQNLSCSDATNKESISNLIRKIDDLVGTLKWIIGLLVPTLLAIIGLLITVFVR